MIPISAVESLLPAIKIKSVVIADPTQVTADPSRSRRRNAIKKPSTLDVRVKVSAITTVGTSDPDNVDSQDFLSIPNFKFKEHLRVAIIQSSHQKATWLLQTLGDEILEYIGPLDQWHGNAKFDDLLYTNVVSRLGISKGRTAAFKSSSYEVQTKKLFEQITKPILEKIDEDGNRVESIPIDFSFTVPQKNPKHLAYFVLCYIDYDSLAESLKIPSQDKFINLDLNPRDFEQLGFFATPLENETVFDDGALSNVTHFFKSPDNKIWTGTVHRTKGGKYMTGLRSSADSVNLTSFQTKNVKIQDFRNREAFMRINTMSDFQDEQAALFNVVGNFDPKLRVLNPKLSAKHPYVSDAFLSVNAANTVKFMFLVNMDSLFTSNSMFGKVIKTSRPSLRREILSKSTIKSMKIYRETVRKVIGSNALGDPAEKYLEQNEAPVLVASVSQPRNFKTVNRTTSLDEETKMSFSDLHIRSFNVVDRDFHGASKGQYRYRLELEIFDGTIEYFREQVFKLRRFADVLKNFASDMNNSLVRPDEERDNPYIADAAVSLSRTREVGGYDSRFGNLTPNYAIKMKAKYSTDIREGIDGFIKIMKIFMHDKNFDIAAQSRIKNFFMLITNPNTVNPESVLSILSLVDLTIGKISSFIGENVEITDPKTKKSENIIGGSNSSADSKTITITKQFGNIADLSTYNVGGYDYLSPSIRQSIAEGPAQIGLKFINGRSYRQRAQSETLRYFLTTTPNISKGMTGGNPPQSWSGGDSAQSNSLTFFAPSIVKVDGLVDILNGDNIRNNEMLRKLEARMALATTEKEKSYETPSFMRTTTSQLRANTSPAIALQDQVDYFATNYSLIPTPPKSITLAERGNTTPALPTEEEDFDPSPLALTDPSTHPGALYQEMFRRDVSKSKEKDAAMYFGSGEENQINLFNLNDTSNYLQRAPRSSVMKLPNQIKALFMAATGNFAEIKTRPFVKPNIFLDPSRGSASTMQYKMLVKVEYLGGFSSSTLTSKKALLMSAPQWLPLTSGAFSKMVGKKLLCRLKKYEVGTWGLTRPAHMDLPIFDEYFILQPDVSFTTPLGAEEDISSESFSDNDIIPEGFGELEDTFAGLREFGRTNRPKKVYRLRSSNFKNIISKLRDSKETIHSDVVADAFNFNRIAVDAHGKRMFVGSGKIPKNSAIAKRISSLPKDKANPSLLEAIKGGKGSSRMELKSNFQSFEFVGRLPQLREKLVELRTQSNIMKQRKETLQQRLKNFNEKKGVESKNLSSVRPTQKNKNSRDALLTRMGKYDNIIDKMTTRMNGSNREMKKLDREERDTVAAIKKEMGSLQTKIIQGRTGGEKQTKGVKQTHKTENPYSSTKNLQASIDIELDRISANEVFVQSKDIEKISKYKSHMSDSDAQEFSLLVDGLKEYSKGEDFSNRMIDEDHRVVGSVSTLVDKTKPDSWSSPPQDLFSSVERKDFNYQFALQEVASIRDALKNSGAPEMYIKQTSIDLAKKIVGRSRLGTETQALAIESIISEIFSDTD